MRANTRLAGQRPSSIVGSSLIALGVLLLLYAAGMYADLVPGSRVSVPRPPALDRPRSLEAIHGLDRRAAEAQPNGASPTAVASDLPAPARGIATSTTPLADAAVPEATPFGAPGAARTPLPAPATVANDLSTEAATPPSTADADAAPSGESPADRATNTSPDQRPNVSAESIASGPDAAEPPPTREDAAAMTGPAPSNPALTPGAAAASDDRSDGDQPPSGQALRLRIPSVGLETEVVPGAVVTNEAGEAEWQTVPFVAAHYLTTALVGQTGNAVISGHVVTRFEGNVFRDLYRVDFGDRIEVETHSGRLTYVIRDLQLVPPTAVEVMAPTQDATLTLITCGGEFDPRTRQFSHRLIVVGKLAEWDRRSSG